MQKGIVNKIILLMSIAILGGCAASATPRTTNTAHKPILSAAEAQAMIRVSVRTLPPPAGQETGQDIGNETIVAAID